MKLSQYSLVSTPTTTSISTRRSRAMVIRTGLATSPASSKDEKYSFLAKIGMGLSLYSRQNHALFSRYFWRRKGIMAPVMTRRTSPSNLCLHSPHIMNLVRNHSKRSLLSNLRGGLSAAVADAYLMRHWMWTNPIEPRQAQSQTRPPVTLSGPS